MDEVAIVERPRFHDYSVEVIASVLEQCRQPRESLASIALGHRINPLIVHKWMQEKCQCQMLLDLQQTASPFVPLQRMRPIPMRQPLSEPLCD